MLKDKLMPGKAKLPGVIPDKWVDPSNPAPKRPDPTLFQKIKNLIGMGPKQETRKWVTDKKYPGTIPGGTPKQPPKAQSTPTPNHKPAEQKTEGLVGRLSALLRSAQ